MTIEYVALTQGGKNRRKNEDRLLINNKIMAEGICFGKFEESCLAVICDGVGGEEGGDIASQIAVETFCECNTEALSASLIIETFLKANQQICKIQKEIPKYKKMATTIAGLAICKKEIISFNVGDTRIYQRNNLKGIEQLSVDHTVANEKYLSHQIATINDASASDFSTLTKYLGGYGRFARAYIKIRHITNEDLFMLCSDGIYKAIPRKQLYNILRADTSLEEKQKAIYTQAQRKGLDDMSMIILTHSRYLSD